MGDRRGPARDLALARLQHQINELQRTLTGVKLRGEIEPAWKFPNPDRVFKVTAAPLPGSGKYTIKQQEYDDVTEKYIDAVDEPDVEDVRPVGDPGDAASSIAIPTYGTLASDLAGNTVLVPADTMQPNCLYVWRYTGGTNPITAVPQQWNATTLRYEDIPGATNLNATIPGYALGSFVPPIAPLYGTVARAVNGVGGSTAPDNGYVFMINGATTSPFAPPPTPPITTITVPILHSSEVQGRGQSSSGKPTMAVLGYIGTDFGGVDPWATMVNNPFGVPPITYDEFRSALRFDTTGLIPAGKQVVAVRLKMKLFTLPAPWIPPGWNSNVTVMRKQSGQNWINFSVADYNAGPWSYLGHLSDAQLTAVGIGGIATFNLGAMGYVLDTNGINDFEVAATEKGVTSALDDLSGPVPPADSNTYRIGAQFEGMGVGVNPPKLEIDYIT